MNSSLQFNRELNRFGLTSVVDAAGGGQNYPADYITSLELAKEGKLTSYFLLLVCSAKRKRTYRTMKNGSPKPYP